MNNSNVLFMKKHADDIQKIITYYYNQGKRIFFWGAGKIGTSFFQLLRKFISRKSKAIPPEEWFFRPFCTRISLGSHPVRPHLQ